MKIIVGIIEANLQLRNNTNASLLPENTIKAIENLIEEAELYLQGKRSQLSILDEMEGSKNRKKKAIYYLYTAFEF